MHSLNYIFSVFLFFFFYSVLYIGIIFVLFAILYATYVKVISLLLCFVCIFYIKRMISLFAVICCIRIISLLTVIYIRLWDYFISCQLLCCVVRLLHHLLSLPSVPKKCINWSLSICNKASIFVLFAVILNLSGEFTFNGPRGGSYHWLIT